MGKKKFIEIPMSRIFLDDEISQLDKEMKEGLKKLKTRDLLSEKRSSNGKRR